MENKFSESNNRNIVYHNSKRLYAKEALNHTFFKIDIDFNNFFLMKI